MCNESPIRSEPGTLAKRNSLSVVVTMISIPELACASSSGIELIRMAWFGINWPDLRSSASAVRVSMQAFGTALVSTSSRGAGQEVVVGAVRAERHVDQSHFDRNVGRIRRRHRHVVESCRWNRNPTAYSERCEPVAQMQRCQTTPKLPPIGVQFCRITGEAAFQSPR